MKKRYRTLEFKEYGDERGNLVVAEGDGKDIPFSIKRAFYIYGSDSEVVRGKHANRLTKFVLINVAGSSDVMVDDGIHKEIIKLDKPRMALFLDTMVWKEMYHFSSDSVLMCLASEHYMESEYIRDYDEFLKEVKKSSI